MRRVQIEQHWRDNLTAGGRRQTSVAEEISDVVGDEAVESREEWVCHRRCQVVIAIDRGFREQTGPEGAQRGEALNLEEGVWSVFALDLGAIDGQFFQGPETGVCSVQNACVLKRKPDQF